MSGTYIRTNCFDAGPIRATGQMPVLLMAALSVHLQFGERGQEAGTVSALERVTHVADVTCQDDTLALKRTNEHEMTEHTKKKGTKGRKKGRKLKRPHENTQKTSNPQRAERRANEMRKSKQSQTCHECATYCSIKCVTWYISTYCITGDHS